MLSQAPFQIQGEETNIVTTTPWEECGSHWKYEGWNKYIGMTILENTVCHIQCATNWICSYTQTIYFVFYINNKNNNKTISFSCLSQNTGIVLDRSLSLNPFPRNHQVGPLLTLWEPSGLFTSYLLVPKFRPPSPLPTKVLLNGFCTSSFKPCNQLPTP